MTSEEANKSGEAIVLDKEDSTFYTDGAQYWKDVEPTVNGMLGGLGFLTDIDIKNSERFLKTLLKLPNPTGTSYALDCGAGIGRITKNLLSRYFDKVDLVDQCPNFIEKAKQNFEGNPKIGEFFCCGLQKFNPPTGKYDVIWIQWVLSHLTDDDLVDLLQRCMKALRPNGLLIVKENCTNSDKVEHDSTDSSATRPFKLFKDLFVKADFKVLKYVKQKNFPADLYPVWSFALSPNIGEKTSCC
ncbi:N-terminal Xaa-Pro-Lys N-methyltransferase 1 [Folsomia candida]|uniref:Alpha N-terminal protein methyltransferase 1 n=1 Tax=Folsomia candida TaxID=158441 RepID=A0A226ELJ0_FOLCA|nr:N-terminal Xaa-Pro-Lys N-methyltransferase 1 [Folsomia candida]